jgi:hypothetical protein
MSSADPVAGTRVGANRKVIMTACHAQRGYCTNLLVTKDEGVIVLNPHIANCCVLRLKSAGRDRAANGLGEWLAELDDQFQGVGTARRVWTVVEGAQDQRC